jgi:Uma2 family endonuclease
LTHASMVSPLPAPTSRLGEAGILTDPVAPSRLNASPTSPGTKLMPPCSAGGIHLAPRDNSQHWLSWSCLLDRRSCILAPTDSAATFVDQRDHPQEDWPIVERPTVCRTHALLSLGQAQSSACLFTLTGALMSLMSRASPKEDRPATRADLDALPETIVGEIIDGTLYTVPRPRPRHADIQGFVAADLKNPFQRGRGGPGGWWILIEPGIEVPGSAEVVPDLAGWRRERLPDLPADPPIVVVPDWVCEILSPTTRRHDQLIKRPFYARIGVSHLWFIDIDARTLSVSQLAEGRWLELGVFGQDDPVRAEPFAAVELSMSDWWPRE